MIWKILKKYKKLNNYYNKFINLNNVKQYYDNFIKGDLRKGRYKKILRICISIIKHILFKKPYILMIETGTLCNLACPTCPTPREIIIGKRNAKNMDLKTFKTLIDNSYKSFAGVILYWTNEPLMNKDITKMVGYCNEKDLYTFISTNGMLLNEKIFREFIKMGLDELAICVDGFSSETYERFREGGNFETLKRNVENICKIKKELKAIKPSIKIQYIKTKQNSEEVVSCQAWADEAGVDAFTINELFVVNHLNDPDKLREEFFSEERWEKWNKKRIHQKGNKICVMPDWQACVLVNGQLTICCMDITGEYSYGNLIEQPYTRVVKNSGYAQIKNKGKRQELSICKGCWDN
jgi:MoaA/NifB/PqqE/SkfB family radical SAM enzyme